MCKLLVAINKSPDNIERLQDIIRVQKDEIFKEPHGLAGLVITNDNKVIVYRDYDDYDDVFNNTMKHIKNAKLIALHSRTGTGGEFGQSNVHFFEDEGCYMAHNGFVMDYKTFGGYNVHDKSNSKGDCDTLQFLKGIDKPLTVKNIELEVTDKRFNGMGIMVDDNKKETFLIIKKDVKAIVDTDMAVFFSFKPDMKLKQDFYVKHFGVKVFNSTEVTELVEDVKQAYEGIYKLEL